MTSRVVACGEEHTIVATAHDVLSCGSNERGQLGLGLGSEEHDVASVTHSQVLMPVPGLRNKSVVQVVCGSMHTLCVTAQSQVCIWIDGVINRAGSGATNGK